MSLGCVPKLESNPWDWSSMVVWFFVAISIRHTNLTRNLNPWAMLVPIIHGEILILDCPIYYRWGYFGGNCREWRLLVTGCTNTSIFFGDGSSRRLVIGKTLDRKWVADLDPVILTPFRPTTGEVGEIKAGVRPHSEEIKGTVDNDLIPKVKGGDLRACERQQRRF